MYKRQAFGWAIAGAVMSFLTGRLITMALLIVSAVYLNKMRKYPTIPYGQPYNPYGQYGANGYGQQTPGYGQPPVQYDENGRPKTY